MPIVRPQWGCSQWTPEAVAEYMSVNDLAEHYWPMQETSGTVYDYIGSSNLSYQGGAASSTYRIRNTPGTHSILTDPNGNNGGITGSFSPINTSGSPTGYTCGIHLRRLGEAQSSYADFLWFVGTGTEDYVTSRTTGAGPWWAEDAYAFDTASFSDFWAQLGPWSSNVSSGNWVKYGSPGADFDYANYFRDGYTYNDDVFVIQTVAYNNTFATGDPIETKMYWNGNEMVRMSGTDKGYLGGTLRTFTDTNFTFCEGNQYGTYGNVSHAFWHTRKALSSAEVQTVTNIFNTRNKWWD